MKSRSPKAKLFVGGSKAPFFTHEKYRDLDEIDYLVMGVVDLVLPQVIRDLVDGKEPVHQAIGNKKVIDTMSHYRQPKVCPEHSWLPHWGIQPFESLPIEIGRGCAFNCKFCYYDKRESARKPLEHLKKELIENFERYGTRFYHFVDDCFNDHPEKVREVCRLIRDLPFSIEWVCYSRFDVAVKFPETADLMVQAGARGLHWGVESLTSEVARRAGKGTPSEKIKEFIVEFSRKYRGLCYTTGSFISGLPGETKESWNHQIDWLLQNENFNFLQISPLMLTPYRHEFDGTAVDYADYSRDPQKYGFEEIGGQGDYWRHATMDSIQAQGHSDEALHLWQQKMKDRVGMTTDIWIYPTLRSFGLSESEVFDCYFNSRPEVRQSLSDKIQSIYLERRSSYLKYIQGMIPARQSDARQITRPSGHS